MGFSLESIVAELQEILSRDQKATKTVKEAQKSLIAWKQYAYDCGQLGEKPERNGRL